MTTSSFNQRLAKMPSDLALVRVLNQKMPANDQLFSLSDYDIIVEIHPTLLKIKQLLKEPNYVKNKNEQQVVELVLSRITSAIR